MAKWLMALGVLLLVLVACASCKKQAEGQSVFDVLSVSDMGLGIALDMTPEQVHAKLGKPTTSREEQGGKVVEDFYLPADVSTTDRATPQLALTYLEGKLVRIYNCYHPEDSAAPLPLQFITPLEGVKLGLAPESFTAALGAPKNSGAADEWRFSHIDGRSVTLLAQYVEMPGTEQKLCCTLTVALGRQMPEDRGEQLNKPSWRELGKDVKEGAGK